MADPGFSPGLCANFQKYYYFYRPKRSFGQGNIFTPVCHSVHRRKGGGGILAYLASQSRGGGIPACLASQSQKGVWSGGVSNSLGGLNFFGGGGLQIFLEGSPIFFFLEGGVLSGVK